MMQVMMQKKADYDKGFLALKYMNQRATFQHWPPSGQVIFQRGHKYRVATSQLCMAHGELPRILGPDIKQVYYIPSIYIPWALRRGA